jgi:hypothetical protein
MLLVRRLIMGASFGIGVAGLAGCGGHGHSGGGTSNATVLFNPATSAGLTAGTQVAGATSGDFNGDGRLDLAVADANNGTLSVLLGNGNGTFGAAVTTTLAAGTDAQKLVAADLDADGNLDLAVTDLAGDRVLVLHGNGDGTFTAAGTVALAAGTDPDELLAIDVNHDGKLDLVVVDEGTGSVSVALGAAGGTFGSATTVSLGAGVSADAVAAGDVNGDGDVDLVVTDEANGNVKVLLGNGTGGFTAGADVALVAADQVSGIALADVDADGDLDLVVADETTDTVRVALGNGDGTFGAAVSFATGLPNVDESIAVADVNADGKLDIVVGGHAASARIAVLLGNGNGTFGTPVVVNLAANGDATVVVGDFDGNGTADVVVGGSAANAALGILLGLNHTISVAFSAAANVNVGAGLAPDAVALVDVNGDGRLDLVVANQAGNSVSIALGNGNGSFQAATSVSLGAGLAPSSIVAADFDANGTIDLAVTDATGSQVSLLTGNGSGSFTLNGTVALPAGASASDLVAGDFNMDGRLDVAIANQATGSLTVALGTAGGFAAPVTTPITAGFQASSVVAADLNGDGKLDLAFSSANAGTVAVMLGNGDGTFAAATTVTVHAGDALTDLVAADLDADGDLDLAVLDQTTGQVSILLNAGNGTFGAATDFGVGADAQAIVAADFNRDGKLDLAVALGTTGRVRILTGNGNGTFNAALDFSANGTGSVALQAADLNGDGKLDLVVVNQSTGNVGVLLSIGS